MLPILGVFLALFGLGSLGVDGFNRDAASKVRATLHGERSHIEVRTGLDLGVLQGDIREVVIRGSGFSAPGLPLFTEPNRPQDGTLRVLRLDLSDFVLGGLHVERLEALIPDCRFDLGLAIGKREIRLTRSGIGVGFVRLSEKDLESFVVAKFHGIQRLKIRISNGRVHAEGHGRFLVFDTDFSVDGGLTIVEGSKIAVTDAVILLDGKPADESSRKLLFAALNPVVDLNGELHLFDAIRMTKLDLGDGVLTASGPASIPTRL